MTFLTQNSISLSRVNQLEVEIIYNTKGTGRAENSSSYKRITFCTTHSCKFRIKQGKLKLLISPYRDVVQERESEKRGTEKAFYVNLNFHKFPQHKRNCFVRLMND